MNHIYKHVDSWIKYLTTTKIGNHPICPYASTAKYQIFQYEDKFSMKLKANFYDDTYDLYVCLPTNQWMTVREAKQIEHEINLVAEDTICLLDHPKNPGYIDGISTSNGKYVIFLIQDKKGLMKARKHLHTTSYYDAWSAEYYKEIVG